MYDQSTKAVSNEFIQSRYAREKAAKNEADAKNELLNAQENVLRRENALAGAMERHRDDPDQLLQYVVLFGKSLARKQNAETRHATSQSTLEKLKTQETSALSKLVAECAGLLE